MPIAVDRVDLGSRADVRRFVNLPYRLYRNIPQWVPPLRRDALMALDPSRHPFYEHSASAFFIARNGHDIGRLTVFDHPLYNAVHGQRQAWFALFECEDDERAAEALFERASEWARSRGLSRIVGPRGLGALDGYGILIDGFEHSQLMTMTNYNPEYYRRLVERLGFVKEIDFVSFVIERDVFVMPDAVRKAAERASRRLHIIQYPSRRTLVHAARRIGETYNRAFVNNWEYYPLTQREVDFLIEQAEPLADHRLMTFIANGDQAIVGFILAFADVSDALRKMNGRLTPWGIARLLIARARTRSVALNGAGILPEYQGRGGNALLYGQIERAVRESHATEAELPQVAETATRMRHDLARLGARPLKTHRVYTRPL
jgi:GNAT superfamily N-acetyltransferase